jgi:hypothetical protein
VSEESFGEGLSVWSLERAGKDVEECGKSGECGGGAGEEE